MKCERCGVNEAVAGRAECAGCLNESRGDIEVDMGEFKYESKHAGKIGPNAKGIAHMPGMRSFHGNLNVFTAKQLDELRKVIDKGINERDLIFYVRDHFKVAVGTGILAVLEDESKQHAQAMMAREDIYKRGNIYIDDIRREYNIRTDIGDVTELATSIKKNGQMQPIGVWEKEKHKYIIVWGNRRLEALRKLKYQELKQGKNIIVLESKEISEEQYYVMNITENMQRKEITPIELGKAVVELRKKIDTSYEDIAEKLSMPMSKIMRAVELYRKTPTSYRGNVGYVDRNEDKKGVISAAVMSKIIRLRLPKNKQEELLDVVSKESVSESDIRLIDDLIHSGLTVAQAVRDRKNYRRVLVDVIVRNDVMVEYIQKWKLPITKILKGKLRGTLRPPENLLWWPEE